MFPKSGDSTAKFGDLDEKKIFFIYRYETFCNHVVPVVYE